jgi:hypothetical protein
MPKCPRFPRFPLRLRKHPVCRQGSVSDHPKSVFWTFAGPGLSTILRIGATHRHTGRHRRVRLGTCLPGKDKRSPLPPAPSRKCRTGSGAISEVRPPWRNPPGSSSACQPRRSGHQNRRRPNALPRQPARRSVFRRSLRIASSSGSGPWPCISAAPPTSEAGQGR